MGMFWSQPVPYKIVINQVLCYECLNRIEDQGTCRCGNVTVSGHKQYLGRHILRPHLASDISLLEYPGIVNAQS